MSTSILTSALHANTELKSQISIDAWVSDQETRGEQVERYRNYYDGDHDAKLTNEMRQMLRVNTGADSAPFNINYTGLVVDTEVDREKLERVGGETDEVNAWAEEIARHNRLDALQMSVHTAATRDGNTFVIADWDNDNKRVRWTHEPAYDGTNGMLVFYESDTDRLPQFAIKVWHITSRGGSIADTMRVNVYYPDRIERFISDEGATTLRSFPGDKDEADTPGVQKWLPGRVPVIHFRNKAVRHDNYGRSSIDDVLPLQDALNRTMHSMVSTSELTGFPVRIALGFNPPAQLTPGMWIKPTGGKPPQADEKVEWDMMEQGEIVPFVQQAEFLIEQIATITSTPIPKTSGSPTASGEALKQRETGLLGKVRRSQVSFGNAWEDLHELSVIVQNAFSKSNRAPATGQFNARWAPAELRNDTDVIKNAVEVANYISDVEFLRLVASVFDWSESDIERLAQERRDEQGQVLALNFPGGVIPGFGDEQFDPTQNGNVELEQETV